MNINHLGTFATIVRCGNFHAAADRLNVTQAAVSMRLKTLEDRVGQPLLNRDRSGVTPTEAGRRLLPYAEQIVRLWDYARAAAGAPVAEVSALRLGVQMSLWSRLLVDWATWLEREAGLVPATLEFDYAADLSEAVRARVMDIALTNISRPDPELRTEPLFEESMILVADRPGRLGDNDLPAMVYLDWGQDFRTQLEIAVPDLPLRKTVIGNGEMGLAYLLEIGGMSYLPRRWVRGLLAQDRLHRVRGAPRLIIPAYAVFREDHEHRALISRALAGLRELRRSEDGQAG